MNDTPGADPAGAPATAPEPKPKRPRVAPPRLGGTFLGGARSRLLPMSVPFRWFGIATAFHLLAWFVLALGATQWPFWRGGLGWPLAALHAVTLGTLVASAVGASLQLLPVATRQGLRWPRLAGWMAYGFVPGLVLLLLGMGLARPTWLAAGGAAVIGVLLLWALLLAGNLRGAAGMPGVLLHGWGALAALLLLAASAASLLALWLGQSLFARDTLRALHLAMGVFGVMGLLLLGLSSVLLPMFALGSVPADRDQLACGATMLAALLLAALAAFSAAPLALRALALAAAAAAFARHVQLMRRVLAGGMRRDLGRAARLFHAGWAAGAAALLLAAAQLAAASRGHADAAETLGHLFVLAAVLGWQGSLLFGVLQRILPFLASMHAARGRSRAPMPSALAWDSPLAWHERGHFVALLLLAAAVVTRSPGWLLAAAAAGAGGALAFAAFFVVLVRRLARAAGDDDQP